MEEAATAVVVEAAAIEEDITEATTENIMEAKEAVMDLPKQVFTTLGMATEVMSTGVEVAAIHAIQG
jgi:hypothetical protein